MTALTEAADTITRWPALLGTKPFSKEFLQALAVYTESEFTQPPPPPAIPAEISRETLTAVTACLAADLASVAQFDTAAKQIRDHCAQSVVNLAHQTIDAVLDAIRPDFTAQAEVFVSEICEVPDDLRLGSGSTAIAHYERAAEAHRALEKYDSFLGSLTVLYGGRPEPALRCLKPVNRDDFQSITDRQGSRKTYEGLHDHWVWAARNSVVFEAHTPPQCAEIRAAIQAQPVERKPFKMADTVRAAPVNRI